MGRGISLLRLALILASAALIAPAWAQAPPTPTVTVAKPIAKRVTIWDEYSGRFEAVETVEVRPRVSGFIDVVHFKDGEIVKAGEPLFTIDPRPFKIAVDSARAEVTRADAQVALAQSELDRATPLVKSGAMTEREITQRSSNLQVAEAQLQVAKANLAAAELNLEWTVVTSPISGRISDRKVDRGNLVQGGTNQPTLLTNIVSLSPIHFVFDASEADYLRYTRMSLNGERNSSRETANPVELKLADETGWPHKGTMNFVDNQLNPRSGTVRGRAIFDNADGLLTPGVFGRLHLYAGEIDALLVPDSVVLSDQMRKVIYTVGEDGVVQANPVTLGPLSDGLRVVRAGLKDADQIILDGLANPMVRPGTKVKAEPGEIKIDAPPLQN